MINQINLKFGRGPSSEPLSFHPSQVTVFVGPNNSGKSRILTEIDILCSQLSIPPTDIINDIVFSDISESDVDALVESIRSSPLPGELVPADNILVGGRRGRMQLNREPLVQSMRRPMQNPRAYAHQFLTHTILKLDGQNRIGLVGPQPAGDLQHGPSNSQQSLFRDNSKREELRRIIKEAFGVYLVIDPTNVGQLRFRLSSAAPKDELEERGIHEAAVNFHSKAQLIDSASDGVKAFIGILSEFIAGDPKILLIDEPEAFLHPALAFLLGLEISRASLRSDKKIFVSTHSASFLMGCIQSGAPVNIIRLTYRDQKATARLLPNNEILTLMRNPLLRSTGVVSGLFYEFVIVTEADADRAFYQEINERLLREKPEWGIPNCLFLHAQNKQTVQTIIRPLRELGIPAAAIVDIDIFKDGGRNWTGLLSAASVPELAHNAMATYRAAVVKAFADANKDMKRDGGIYALEGEQREAASNLIHSLNDYGIFIVPGGELESWLKHLDAKDHGPNWLISVFEKMGEDPTSSEYLKPDENDVWSFMGSIRQWLIDANRKGIPS